MGGDSYLCCFHAAVMIVFLVDAASIFITSLWIVTSIAACDDPLIDLVDHIVWETFAKVNQEAWVKRGIFLKLGQSDKVLGVRVFRDLTNRFTVAQMESLLDDERTKRTKRNTYGHRLFPCVGGFELRGIVSFNFPPGNEEGELNPPILLIQFSAKGKEKIVWHHELKLCMFVHVALHVQGFNQLFLKNPCI